MVFSFPLFSNIFKKSANSLFSLRNIDYAERGIVMVRSWISSLKLPLLVSMGICLTLLVACGTSATEEPEPAATTPAGAPAATASPAAGPATQAAPQAIATPSGPQTGAQPTSPPAPAATPTPLPEPTPTDVAQASVKPSGTLVAALTEVYPFQSAPSRVQAVWDCS